MTEQTMTLMLCGDVMTGRGIDQILPNPSPPILYEDHAKSALDYVRLAEAANGAIERLVGPAYIWGDLLELFEQRSPDLRIVNLETAVTSSPLHWPKGINYRMSPANIACLTAAAIDCCGLANNHVLDWGDAGLLETLDTLRAAGIATAGAGHNAEEAAAPAILPVEGGGRVLVYAIGRASSGVPEQWAAGRDRPGVNWLAEGDPPALARLLARITRDKGSGDIVVCSIHWGPNWGHDIDPGDRSLSHRLIEAGVDLIHGHSSHHPKALEVFRDKLILHGCGDFLNDYEGIGAHGGYRSDLAVLYLARIDRSNGTLAGLEMVPYQIRNFRLNRAEREDAEYLARTLDRESGRFGGEVRLNDEGSLEFTAGQS